MAVLFDTTRLEERDRSEALGAAFSTALFPLRSRLADSTDSLSAVVQVWPLGVGVTFMHNESTGVNIERTAREVRASAPETISLGLPLVGSVWAAQHFHRYDTPGQSD